MEVGRGRDAVRPADGVERFCPPAEAGFRHIAVRGVVQIVEVKGHGPQGVGNGLEQVRPPGAAQQLRQGVPDFTALLRAFSQRYQTLPLLPEAFPANCQLLQLVWVIADVRQIALQPRLLERPTWPWAERTETMGYRGSSS